MKRIIVSGLSVALLFGVVGCGPAGMDAGAPAEGGKGVPIDGDMTNPGKRFGTGAAKAADTKNAAAKNAPSDAPAPAPAAP